MLEKDLLKYYKLYTTEKMKVGALISVPNFKKYLLFKKLDISSITENPAWLGVRGNLNVLYEDALIEKAAMGGRNAQVFTQLLNKFYDKQMKQGNDIPPVKVELSFAHEGRNKI